MTEDGIPKDKLATCPIHGLELQQTRLFHRGGDKVGRLTDPYCPACSREEFREQFEQVAPQYAKV